MNDLWQKLSAQVSALAIRERVIVLAGLTLLILFIWAQVVFIPLQDRQTRASNLLSSLNQQQIEMSEMSVLLEKQLKHDPNLELRVQQAELQLQLQNMKEEIESQMSELIAPEKMADVLRSLLHDQKNLHLVSLRNLPVKAFHGTDEHVVEGETALFYHSMELVIEGEYFNILDYVKQLEQLKGFKWQAFNYEVLKYPKAKVTLSIGTLSLEEDWIGV